MKETEMAIVIVTVTDIMLNAMTMMRTAIPLLVKTLLSRDLNCIALVG